MAQLRKPLHDDEPMNAGKQRLLDFGKGFYLTSLVEQARKYDLRSTVLGETYLNQDELDEDLDKHKIKVFQGYDEEWLYV